MLGAAWGPDGRIVFSVWRGGLYEVPAGGGDARMYVALDSTTVDFHGPTYLPDGRGILAFQHRKDGANAIVVVEGSPPRAHVRVRGFDRGRGELLADRTPADHAGG